MMLALIWSTYFESHLLVGFLNLDTLFLGNLGQLGVGVGFM